MSQLSGTPNSAIQRLTREYRALIKNPIDGVVARPDPANLLNWYFVIDGPDHPALVGGKYFGRCVLPENYPYSPPSMFIDTPSSIFSTNENICMTNTAYHAENWTTTWTVGSLINSLRMFMIARYSEVEFRDDPFASRRVTKHVATVTTKTTTTTTTTKAPVANIQPPPPLPSTQPTQPISAVLTNTLHYTNLSLYTTYRIKEFQRFFPDLKREFKYKITLDSFHFFQQDDGRNLDLIRAAFPLLGADQQQQQEQQSHQQRQLQIALDQVKLEPIQNHDNDDDDNVQDNDDNKKTENHNTIDSTHPSSSSDRSNATTPIPTPTPPPSRPNPTLITPATFNRVPTPTILPHAIDDFNTSTQVYINHLDRKIPKGVTAFMKASPCGPALVWIVALAVIAVLVQFLVLYRGGRSSGI